MIYESKKEMLLKLLEDNLFAYENEDIEKFSFSMVMSNGEVLEVEVNL